MKKTEANLKAVQPMVKVPTAYDATKLEAHRRCPRYYMFRHVLGWVSEEKSPALVFGSSWHRAAESLAQTRGDSQESRFKAAMTEFLREWVESGLDEDAYPPRTIETATNMLHEYVAWLPLFESTIKRSIGVEVPFVIDIGVPGCVYCGRVDEIVQLRDGLYALIEIKTSTLVSDFWAAGFRNSPQIEGYQAAVQTLLADPEKFWGTFVVAAKVKKKAGQDSFRTIPCLRDFFRIDRWLRETSMLIREIEEDTRLLGRQSDGPIPFPRRNGPSCIQWNRPCEYMDFCVAYPEPWRFSGPPAGMKVEFWDPTSHIGIDLRNVKS